MLLRASALTLLVSPVVALATTTHPPAAASSQAQSPSRPAAPAGLRSPTAAQQVQETGESVVKTELVQLSPTIEPGKPFEVGIRYTMAPKWHVYWKNPGDSGAPPAVEWTLPEGFTAGPLTFPRPTVMEHPDETTIGYDGTFVIKVTMRPPAEKPLPAKLELKAKLDWFVCSTRCLMGSREHTLALTPSGATAPAVEGEYPVTLEALGIAARVDGSTLVILRAPGSTAVIADGTSVRFIPGFSPGVTYGKTVPDATAFQGPEATLSIPMEIKPQNSLGQPLRVAGLITLTTADGKAAGSAEFVIPLKQPEASTVAPPAKATGATS